MHANPKTPGLTRITRNLLTGLTALAVFSAMRAPADTILSQNFDGDPLNYTSTAFQGAGTSYWNLSTAAITPATPLTGNATTYLTGCNMNSGGLTFGENTPPGIDFVVSVAGFSDLQLSVALAGSPAVETINYVRCKADNDGDGSYETTLFNFTGGAGNNPYIDATLGNLSLAFTTFSNISLPPPADGNLRLRFELYNDSDSNNENAGIDDILVTGIPTGGNIPPSVSITSPANNETVGADFTIEATATDADGIASVKFYDGATLLDTDTTFPYNYNVVGAAYGSHLLRAVAEDTLGATTQSSIVTVYILDPATPFGINVNMDSTVQTGLEGPGGGLGAVWNTIGASSASNLRHTSGPATSVGFTSSGTGGWGLGETANFDPALRMLKRGYVNFGAEGTTQQLVITGLDSARTYDLSIASAILITTNQRGRGEWSTANMTSTAGNQTVDNRASQNSTTWVRGNNYVLFEDVVPDVSGEITVNGYAITEQPTYDIRLALNGFQLVESTPLIAGPVDNAMSTVTATPAAVVANGVSAATVKVTLRDASGVRVPNKEVTLANNGGLTPPAALTTNAQGEAGFSVSSSTVATVVFTATVVADSLTLTDTASVEFTDPEAPVAFNVNFHAGTPATGLLGVVGAPGETWNQGTTSAGNLIDATGAVVSSVNVTGANGDGYTVNAALKVFAANRNFFSKAQDTTISITGLVPNTAYDLYIYSLSHNNGSWGNFTDTERAAGDFVTSNTVLGNGQSQWLDNGLPGVNGSTFVANGNYVVFQSIVSSSLGNISVLADAHDGIDGNPSTSDGDCRLHLSGLQIRPSSGMSLDYAAWRDTRYPGLGLPDADDDGDGWSNDFERIFGMNPTDSASSSPYRAGFDRATGSLGYTRRIQSLVNMKYKVWYSTDLIEWFEDNAALQTSESVTNDVEFMGVSIDPVLLNQPELFVRVAATPITELDPEPSLVNLWGSGNSITVLFSEPMNPSSAANPLNYQVLQTGGGTIAVTGVTLSSDGGSATLTLASALGNNTGYTVNLDGLTSGTGQSLGSGVSRQFKTWDDNPNGIKVFILAGQSNMVGYGNVETGNSGAGTVGSLRYLAVNDASYPDYNYASLLTNPGQPATSPFRTRSNVKVWWRDGGADLGGSIRKGDLGPPFKGADNGKIGPEFAFGHVIGDFYPSNNVLLVKAAWGGRSLVKDFRPPGAVAARGGRVGDFFSAIIDNTRDVLSNLDTEFPEWSGQGYQIVGFGWHQGFNDLIDATASAEYKDNLPDFIKDVREVFGKPNLPFAIASTGMDAGPAEPPPYTGYRAIEKAQLWVAGVPRPANVLSTDARPFWRVAAVSPSNEGYHWNWNAETYFLIGKSLGDNMVDLLTP